jgi:CBS domain containing-hemolysin-like protein
MIAELTTTVSAAIWIAVLLAATCLSFGYSSLEMAVYIANKVRLQLQAGSGVRAARILQNVIRDPRNFIAIILAGNNIANYALTFSVSALFVLAGKARHAELYTLLVATPVTFLLCESLPKNIAQRIGGTMAYRLVWLLRASQFILTVLGVLPLVRGFANLTTRLLGKRRVARASMLTEGVAAVVAEGHASGVLTHFQSIMADRVMNIAGVRLRKAMIPMRQATSAPAGISRAALVELAKNCNFSRVPLLDEKGKVVGVVNVLDVLMAGEDATPVSLMDPPFRLPADMTVTDAMYHMQREHQAMAIVQDDPGRHIGIATIKDLVEEIVGELEAW